MSSWYDFPGEGGSAAESVTQGTARGTSFKSTNPYPANLESQARYQELFGPHSADADDLLTFASQWERDVPPESVQSSPYQAQSQAIPPATDVGVTYQATTSATDSIDDRTALERGEGKHKRRLRKKDMSSYPAQRAGPKKRPRAPSARAARAPSARTARAPSARAARNNGQVSKLGQRKQILGDDAGFDYRPREKVKNIDGTLYGLVDNKWRPAGYHRNFREKLILHAATQPGAPVWRPGMTLNYTSYSPITQGWTDDLSSMKDSKGRDTLWLPSPPPDYVHMPKCGYLMFEGLVMLDDNNRPIKDFPGAPLTLETKVPGHLLEGLRRYFGMTHSDLLVRMPPERITMDGKKYRQICSRLQNNANRWLQDKGLGTWFRRGESKAKKPAVTFPSGPSEGGPDATEPLQDWTFMPSLLMDESSETFLNGSSSIAGPSSAATTVSNGYMPLEYDEFWRDQGLDYNQLLAGSEMDPLSAEIPPSASTFREANMPAHCTNMVEGTYSPGHPSGFGPEYIQSTDQNGPNNLYYPDHPSEFATEYIQTTSQLPSDPPQFPDQSTSTMFDFGDFLNDLRIDEDENMVFSP